MTKNPAIPSYIVAPTPEEIRKRFDYHVDQWKDIREEARIDMQLMAGDPWVLVPGERDARKAIKRMCLDFDELSQYINQLVNGVRQNKRAPKVTPAGNGANDQTAEMRAGMIKAIGYKSNADAARITAFENAAMRSYGSYKLKRRYISDSSEMQEIRLVRMPNPDVLYMDPDAKEADYSDARDAFELDQMSKEEFVRRFTGAEIKSFSTEQMTAAPKWVWDEKIQLAEYWKSHERKRTRLRFDDDETGYLDEAGSDAEISPDSYLVSSGMKSRKVRNQRDMVERFVVQYLFNGVELLEEHPWTITVTNPQTGKSVTGGKYIPYLLITGKELYVDTGSGAKRQIQSLIRMARTPYMAYCYTRTAQLEAIQLTSKSPYFVYEGQVENHEAEMKTLNKIPVAYQEVKPTVEGAPPGQLLPFPQRPSYVPEVQQLEVFAQASRQAIQAAIGFSNPQVQRNRSSPISGKALEEFEAQGDIKTFHFVDNYDRILEFEGRMIDDLIPVVYDTERQQAIVGNDDKPKLITLNGPPDEEGHRYPTDEGDHELTISTGPSYDSQRQEQNEFSKTLVANPQLVTLALQNPQSSSAKILALAIRMSDLGPLGDAMAEAIDPAEGEEQPIPPQVKAAMQQMQQQLQAAVAMVGNLQQELKEKTQFKEMELASKRATAADRNRTDLVIAQLKLGMDSAQAQLDAEMRRIEFMYDKMQESELAPNPDDVNLGLHPDPPMPDPEAAGDGAVA